MSFCPVPTRDLFRESSGKTMPVKSKNEMDRQLYPGPYYLMAFSLLILSAVEGWVLKSRDIPPPLKG